MAHLLKRQYVTFNYPNSSEGSKTLLTGIRGYEDKFYITGFYEEKNKPNIGFIFKGDISERSEPRKWHTLSYPSSCNRTVVNTSPYGPAVLSSKIVRVVGNYTTKETGKVALGFMYQGNVYGDGCWITLNPQELSEESIINTIAHSTIGDLVVGNYDTEIAKGKGFIYDIRNGHYYNIYNPNESELPVSITAYGIWQNKDDNYTICGGYVSAPVLPNFESGYVVDWNNITRQFYNFTEFNFENNKVGSTITHFNGINAVDKYSYYLTGDAVSLEKKGLAFIAKVDRYSNCDQIFDKTAKWNVIDYPTDNSITSGNSIYNKVVIGVYTTENGVNGYLSFVKKDHH